MKWNWNWMQSMWGRAARRKKMLSFLALGVGVTALGISQRRRWGGPMRQMMQPFRRLVKMRG